MTSIPLVCSFWFMLTAYIVHIMDESLLGGNFCREGPPALVARVFLAQVFLVQHWLPAHYERKHRPLGSPRSTATFPSPGLGH